MKSSKIKAIWGIGFIVFLFIITTYLVETNIEFVKSYLDFGIYGILIYILLVIASIVIAPVSVIPVIPLAIGLWGWKLAAFLSILGWSIGAAIAFLLARKYGIPLVAKFIPLKEIDKFEKRIPEKHVFWTIVFLRMVTPVDGLSYLFGLFPSIKFRTYMIATVIGITPFTIMLTYLGSISVIWQIIGLGIALIILLIGISIANRKMLKSKNISSE